MPRAKRLKIDYVSEILKADKPKHFSGSVDSWQDQLIPNFDPEISSGEKGNFWHATIIASIIIVSFFSLFLRLFHLQIANGQANKELADGNRIQVKVIHAPRGVIYDRNGKIVALNSPGFRLKDPGLKSTKFVTRQQYLDMEAKNDPRVNYLEVDSIRKYPEGLSMAHILGYVSGDGVGASGIEKSYEDTLKGKDGGEIIEVDATGKAIRTLRTIAPTPGNNLNLAIDADLQNKAYLALKNAVMEAKSCCGVVVGLDPTTGEILTMVSYPSFDNNIFSESQSADLVQELFKDANSPVLNRAIGGTYPPGSTFKIVSALAALESTLVTPDTVIEDTGVTKLGAYSYANWYFTQYGKSEGVVNLSKALQRSNDTYFYLIGDKIGNDRIAEWSRNLYLGKTLGLDIDGEVAGLVADGSWKQANFGQPWYPGDTLHMAIGQGFLLTTPLQVAGFTSYIAENGKLYKPHLLKSSAQVLDIPSAQKMSIHAIKQGLEMVTKEGGTAWPFFKFPIATAGKTGTAEFGDPKGRTHAWYTGYAPVDDPKVVMTVLIEAGGEGSSIASPVAKEILRWYFSPDKNNLIKDNN